jgi:hypothetical protein
MTLASACGSSSVGDDKYFFTALEENGISGTDLSFAESNNAELLKLRDWVCTSSLRQEIATSTVGESQGKASGLVKSLFDDNLPLDDQWSSLAPMIERDRERAKTLLILTLDLSTKDPLVCDDGFKPNKEGP